VKRQDSEQVSSFISNNTPLFHLKKNGRRKVRNYLKNICRPFGTELSTELPRAPGIDLGICVRATYNGGPELCPVRFGA